MVGIGIAIGLLMAVLTIISDPASTGLSRNVPTPVPDNIREGEPAPEFTTTTPSGQPLALSDYEGIPVAINFWATWCGPCVVEMPALQRAADTYADGRLVVIGVNAGESPEKVQQFLDENELTFPIAMDPDGDIIDQYAIRVFPTTVWVDADGVVRAEHFGPLTEDLIEQYVDQLLSMEQASVLGRRANAR